MLVLNHLHGFGVKRRTASATPYSVVYKGTIAWSSGSTISGSVDIGAADAAKEIFLVSNAVGNGAFRTLTAASTTVDGNAVTKFTTEFNPAGALGLAGGFVAVPTSSGSVTITATYSGTLVSGVVAVYAVYSRPKTSGSNETDSSSNSASSVTSITVSGTTINDNGIWFGTHVHFNTNATTSPAAEDYDASQGASTQFVMCSRDVQVSSSTPSDQWSWTGSVNARAASWSFD